MFLLLVNILRDGETYVCKKSMLMKIVLVVAPSIFPWRTVNNRVID